MRHEPAASEPAGPWLDTAAAARHLGKEPGTLRGWRSIGKGPAFHLVSGQFIRYHADDLEAFARRCESALPAVKPSREGDEK
jgi:hypothetical protein